MKLLILCLVAFLAFGAFAASEQVISITNDIDTNLVTINVNSVDGKLISIGKVETSQTNQKVNEESYTLQALFVGSTVQVKKNRDIVKIRLEKSFDATYGGGFVLEYVVNAITGEKRSMDFDLLKNGTKWEVTSNNKKASKLHVVGNRKPIIGVVGVAKIQVL